MARKKEFAIGSLLILVVTLAYIFGWSGIFAVKSITVIGNDKQISESQVIALTGIHNGEKLARIDIRKVSLENFNWIKRIEVRKNWWQGEVTLKVVTRNPVARSGTHFVDDEGYIFDPPIPPTAKLPQFNFASNSDRKAAAVFFTALPIEFSTNISEVAPGYAITLPMSNKTYLILWGENINNSLKIKVFTRLIALPENKNISKIDLSDPTKPVVK